LTPWIAYAYTLPSKSTAKKGRIMKTHPLLILPIVILLLLSFAAPAAALEIMSRNPYKGAIAVDAATGTVLYEENADAEAYPASITKLMVLLVTLEAVEAGRLTLDEEVKVTAKSSTIGGSQVYLKDNEVFTVDDMLYALMVQSANDAAVALAIHYLGSKAAFVDLMNKRAHEIGMKDTVFHSVHGLPPGRGQLPDVSTPRDIAKLCRKLLENGNALRYTSTWRRPFRTDAEVPFLMENHNRLLKELTGCDGFKTGFFWAAGFSIAATARDAGQRVIAVVLGARSEHIRDEKAKKLLTEGLQELVTNAPGASSTLAH
jgi:D-alanyl-D-alanine carboxypeptidase (penicillin-binding protein 5/6)